jgi:hypothetical protein
MGEGQREALGLYATRKFTWSATEIATERSTSAKEHVEKIFWAELSFKRGAAEWTRRESW